MTETIERNNSLTSGESPDEEYTPVYDLRSLTGQETIRVYQIVRGVANDETIAQRFVDGGMEGAQTEVIRALADRLEHEVLPLMIGLIKGNENLFKDIPNLRRQDLRDHLTADEAELEEKEQPDVAELRHRESWQRVEQWMEKQDASAPIDLFNDMISHDSFLKVFKSASTASRLVKKVSAFLGIEFGKDTESGSQTENSSNGQSQSSSEGSSE